MEKTPRTLNPFEESLNDAFADAEKAAVEQQQRARRAVAKFREMQGGLQGYLREATGNKDLRLIVTPGAPCTDGKNVYMRPPIELGDNPQHEYPVCRKRDVDDVLLCEACRVNEETNIVIRHELGHHVADTFAKVDDDAKIELLRQCLAERGVEAGTSRADKIKEKFEQQKVDNFMGAARLVSPWMPMLVNALEDARVNTNMYKALPGLEKQFRGLNARLFREGIDKGDGERFYWDEAPLGGQAIIGAYLVASKHKYHYFDSRVIDCLEDPEMQTLLDRVGNAKSIDAVFRLAYPVLEVIRKHGICVDKADDKDDEEPPPSPPMPQQPKPDEGEQEPANQPAEGDPDDDEQDESPGDGTTGDEEDESGPGDDDSQDGPDGPGESDDADGDGEPGDDEGDGSGDPERPDDLSGDEGGGDRSVDDTSSDVPGDDDDADAEDGAPDGPSRETGSASDDAPPSTPGMPDENAPSAPDLLSDDDEPDDNASDAPSGGEALEESDGDNDDASSDGQDGEDDDPDLDEDFDYGENPDYAGDIDSGSVEESEELLNKASGHDKFDKGQGGVGDGGGEIGTDLLEIDRAIVQGEFFDDPSRAIYGVDEYHADADGPWLENGTTVPTPEESLMAPALQQIRITFSENAKGTLERNLKSGKINTKALGRRAPIGDPRLFQKKREPGKRDYFVVIGLDVSGSTSGRRVEMIKATAQAQIDLLNRAGIKVAVYAHSCASAYSDETDERGYRRHNVNLAINVIKEPNERWGAETKARLARLTAYGANLDGHSMEYYRKVCDRVRATDKMILYYTDGAMPASNYDEELAILQREIAEAPQRNIKIIGVGVGNDDPKQHGLDTIRLDTLSDVGNVVKELRKRIIGR